MFLSRDVEMPLRAEWIKDLIMITFSSSGRVTFDWENYPENNERGFF